MKLLIASTLTALLLGMVWLVSCATRPALAICPALEYREACSRELGCGMFIDEEQSLAWQATIEGLSKGTCRRLDQKPTVQI